MVYDYSKLAVHPEVLNSIMGNTNGEAAARQLWEMVGGDPNITQDRLLIADKVNKLTDGQVRNCPNGLCLYSEELRILVLNVTRENWRTGEGRRLMYIIGAYLEKQGLKYRHLRGAAPDGSTILIVALPLKIQPVRQQVQEDMEVYRETEVIIPVGEQPIKTPVRTVRRTEKKYYEQVVIEDNED